MIEFKNRARLVQSIDELPNYTGVKDIYLDCETGSGDPKVNSTNPWFNCFTAGIAITADDDKHGYYIPIGHKDSRWNLPRDSVIRWLGDVFATCKRWINQNIKYDMHVCENDLGLPFSGEILDLMTLAKTFESDRLSYAIESLAADYLKYDISELKKAFDPYLRDRNGNLVNRDYSTIPADLMGEYAGEDVLTARRLYKYFSANLYESRAFEIEREVTPVLYRMENTGMRTVPKKLIAQNILHLERMIEIEGQLEKQTGVSVRPHVNDDCHDLLCNHYGLPVLKWTNEDDEEKESSPSFAKDVLKEYLVYPGAPVDIIRLLQEYRTKNTFRSFFLEPYSRLHRHGILHPDYNQSVRTGRMSCKAPNAQQLNKLAKTLIIPPDGYGFLSIDYSQIEFRLIAHYISDPKAIAAYNANPDTDFHQWVAELCNIVRKPAKTVNFCMGYGGGKKRLLSVLSKELDLVLSIKEEVDALGLPQAEANALFEQKALARAEGVFNGYHKALPSLRRTSKKAERVARARGYVFNLFGRRRYLDRKRAHIAFNALNQSTAADIMKERLPFIQACADMLGLEIVAIVHDEVLFQGPISIIENPRTQRDMLAVMESPQAPLSIPIRCSYGTSRVSWAKADDEKTWPLEDSTWLKTLGG